MRILILLTTILLSSNLFAASDSAKIIAVVGEQIISSVDLEDRIALVAATTGIVDNEENRNRLAPQILNQLINEKLQLQEAERMSINTSDVKVQEAISAIEKQSNKPSGSLLQFIASRGIPQRAIFDQVRAQVAWSEVAVKKIRPKVLVSDAEVSRYKKRKETNDVKNAEIFIATIQIPIESADKEKSAMSFAEKLVGELKSGASFSEVAKQFSSNKVNEPFWIDISSLDPLIIKGLSQVTKGGVSDPIKTEAGFAIVKLLDMREKPASSSVAQQEVQNIDPSVARQAIFAEKFELEAQKFMRNLKNETFIEIRNK
jgi:peptidyl-prolyl cis-trans isomerase SurA